MLLNYITCHNNYLPLEKTLSLIYFVLFFKLILVKQVTSAKYHKIQIKRLIHLFYFRYLKPKADVDRSNKGKKLSLPSKHERIIKSNCIYTYYII